MVKEKISKIAAVLIVVAFIIGAAVGYLIKDTTQTTHEFGTGENILKNSGFEDGTGTETTYWYKAYIYTENLSMNWDDAEKYSGEKSVSIYNIHNYSEEVSNNWAQTISLFPVDKTLELSGWVKTVDAENVVMVIQCWGKDNNLTGFGTTQTAYNITGTTDWTEYTASVYVPSDTESIIVRLALTGTGQVWFDNIELLVK